MEESSQQLLGCFPMPALQHERREFKKTFPKAHLLLGHVMRMPEERVARQVLFGQLRGTRPIGSPPVTLRGLMRKDVLLLNGGGGSGSWSALISRVHGEGCMAD